MKLKLIVIMIVIAIVFGTIGVYVGHRWQEKDETGVYAIGLDQGMLSGIVDSLLELNMGNGIKNDNGELKSDLPIKWDRIDLYLMSYESLEEEIKTLVKKHGTPKLHGIMSGIANPNSKEFLLRLLRLRKKNNIHNTDNMEESVIINLSKEFGV